MRFLPGTRICWCIGGSLRAPGLAVATRLPGRVEGLAQQEDETLFVKFDLYQGMQVRVAWYFVGALAGGKAVRVKQ